MKLDFPNLVFTLHSLGKAAEFLITRVYKCFILIWNQLECVANFFVAYFLFLGLTIIFGNNVSGT